MSDKTRYMKDLYRDGDEFVLRLITGTVCPCWSAYRSTGYSKQWHQTGNPGAAVEDCNGTGILVDGRVTTDINLKGRIIPIGNISTEKLPEEWKTEIGNIKQDMLYLIGSVDVDASKSTGTPTFYSLLDLEEQVTDIIYDDNTYKLRRVENIYNTGQQGLLVRHE